MFGWKAHQQSSLKDGFVDICFLFPFLEGWLIGRNQSQTKKCYGKYSCLIYWIRRVNGTFGCVLKWDNIKKLQKRTWKIVSDSNKSFKLNKPNFALKKLWNRNLELYFFKNCNIFDRVFLKITEKWTDLVNKDIHSYSYWLKLLRFLYPFFRCHVPTKIIIIDLCGIEQLRKRAKGSGKKGNGTRGKECHSFPIVSGGMSQFSGLCSTILVVNHRRSEQPHATPQSINQSWSN